MCPFSLPSLDDGSMRRFTSIVNSHRLPMGKMGRNPRDERPTAILLRTSNRMNGAVRMHLLIGAILLLTSPATPAQQLLAANVARAYGDEPADGREVFAGPAQLPANVAIAPAFAFIVVEMLRRSPTFRAQCSRIAVVPHVQVVVRQSLQAPRQSAVTRFTRRNDGRLEADVEINPFGDDALLIAHEFEHIIEQLDDVNLQALANRRGTGVRTDPESGHFETERATDAGRRVAREVSRAVARR